MTLFVFVFFLIFVFVLSPLKQSFTLLFLFRTLHLAACPTSLCFHGDKGDLLIGIGFHLYHIPYMACEWDDLTDRHIFASQISFQLDNFLPLIPQLYGSTLNCINSSHLFIVIFLSTNMFKNTLLNSEKKLCQSIIILTIIILQLPHTNCFLLKEMW